MGPVRTRWLWSESPDDCDLIVLAGDCYSPAFKDQTGKLAAPRWAHTEDALTDGLENYIDLQACLKEHGKTI